MLANTKHLVFPLLVTLLVVTTFTAFGHKYLETENGQSREDPVLVTDHQVSWAAYEKLETADQVDYFKFTANRGEEIYASLIIPKIDRLVDFHPALALIGPGLKREAAGGGNPDELPLDVREGEGLLVKEYEGENNETFFEPFTQTNYWEHQVIRKKAPEDGTYYVAVWNSKGKTGKYVLAIGEKEDFGLKDILEYPSVWWKVRMFAERQLSTYLIAGTVLTALLVGSALLISAFL